MKKLLAKPAAKVVAPVFPEMPHQFRPVEKPVGSPKPPKRDNTFSISRDTREDRGTRKMKTTQNTRTLPHGA
jgi:hypothetical protein